MVNVRYYLVVYTKNNIPVRVEYTTSAGVVCGEKTPEDTTCLDDGETEYYAEYDSLSVFLYVNDKTNKINKKRTWIQDFKKVDNKTESSPSDYKPKTTIKYINE